MQFIKDHFKFVFTIILIFTLHLHILNVIEVNNKNNETINELNFNYLVFRVDCLNQELEPWQAFKDYLKRMEETNDKFGIIIPNQKIE